MEPTINAPIGAVVEALATAAALPLTAIGEKTPTLVRSLARITATSVRSPQPPGTQDHSASHERIARLAVCRHPNFSPSITPQEVHHGRPRPVHH